MKDIKKIITQPKSDNDWRSFTIAEDSEGNVWQLRGYGGTREEAENDAKERFKDDEEYWDTYGYIIKEKE